MEGYCSMNKTLVGICTFGGLKYSQLAIENTQKFDVDLVVVIGKPGDSQTLEYLKNKGIPYIQHNENKGFPASLNDIYDYFLAGEWQYLIIQGNDVIPYPNSISRLVEIAELGEHDWIGAKEVSVRALVKDNPEIAHYFTGDDLVCNDFTAKPWEIFKGHENTETLIDGAGLADCQNLNLYTRKAIEVLGYVDVNFFGNGYYCDNDYVKRAIELKIPSCTVTNAFYFHFWSRTIKEELHSNNYFAGNKQYYILKWGGEPGQEKFTIPFNGTPHKLKPLLDIPCDIDIKRRDLEHYFIEHWRK